jgi:hypothetical protein
MFPEEASVLLILALVHLCVHLGLLELQTVLGRWKDVCPKPSVHFDSITLFKQCYF